jgi:hypothetical protein
MTNEDQNKSPTERMIDDLVEGLGKDDATFALKSMLYDRKSLVSDKAKTYIQKKLIELENNDGH